MLDQKGGILSKLVIPAAVVVISGIFFLGYYMGRYQGKSGASDAGLPPLPEVAPQNPPRPEEYTFFKTLTAREDKTVSIDLRPKPAAAGGTAERKRAADAPKEKEPAARSGKKTVPEQTAMIADRKTPEPKEKEAPARKAEPSPQRYSVQISSQQEKQAAEREVKKMRQKGFAAYIVSSEIPGKGSFYRVRVGRFPNRTTAEKLQKDIRAKAGISSVVVTE